ncbi:MAG TPA: nuclear transport factor 2 family protein [Hanamia sp.]
MFRNIRFSCLIILSCTFILFSCNASKHNKSGVQSAMTQYDHYIQKMDIDSLAMLFTPDGDLGNVAHGRDSIRKFLSKFKNFKVLSQSSTTESINVNRDLSVQKGIYHQTTIIPVNDTVTVKGEYTATWEWLSKVGWRLKRMVTKPIK